MIELDAHGIRYAVDRDVYDPSDDTFLLIEAVRGLRPGRLLEVGTGAGLVAIAAAQGGHDVVATDTSIHALRLARDNARRNGVRIRWLRADLLRGLRPDAFDAIVFNPPYLPTSPQDHVPGPLDAAFDGGPDGWTVTRRFLEQARPRARTLLLVTSTLQATPGWHEMLSRHGLDAEITRERGFGHERLRVVRLTQTRKD